MLVSVVIVGARPVWAVIGPTPGTAFGDQPNTRLSLG
jgi:hypothetical protein